MSNFGKPRSYATPPGKHKFRERQYPYIFSKRKVPQTGPCEACSKYAEHVIDYYMDKNSSAESCVFLCGDHEKLTRYGKWDQVFRDIDRKCDRGSK